MRQTELHLTDEDRLVIERIRAKELHQSREVNRAHVLSCLDRGIPEAQIMEVLGIGRTALWRTRSAYLQGGVDLAVFDLARSGRPPQYDIDAEARVTRAGLLGAARGSAALDAGRTRTRCAPGIGPGHGEPGDRTPHAQKNALKPWRRLMWCIGTLTQEYRRRMYKLLALYAKPLRCDEPVICIDEKSLQLLAHSREPLPIAPGVPAKQDYEYVRKGTTNLFVAVEPKAGQRVVSVTAHRSKTDFVGFVQELLTDTYAARARCTSCWTT